MASDTFSDKNGDSLPSLPDKWKWATLGEISSHPQYGWTTKAVDNGSLQILRTTDITSGHIDWSRVPFCLDEPPDKDKYLLKDGDVVVSRAGSVGFSHLVKNPPAAVFASYLIRFKPAINERYFALFLKSPLFWKAISENAAGIALQNVNASKLRQISIPLAPFGEQNRIVERIEELLTQLEAGVAALEKVQAQLRRYRQAVLKAAFEGRLTSDWREQHEIDEELVIGNITKIWEKYHKGKKFSRIDSAELPALPVGWVWATFNQVSQRVTVGHVGPMKDEYVDQGFPFLRSQNVRANRFDAHGLKYISPEFHQELQKSILVPGDLVVVRSGNVGVSCVIPEYVKEANCADLVIVKQPFGILPSLGAYYMNSTALRRINAKKVGVALTHFNTKSMADMVVPLPPLEEQDVLLTEIARLFSIAEEVSKTAKVSLNQADSLRRSILKRAFEGKLMPQDPNDEPAAVLLERIKAAKAKQEPGMKRGKKVQTTSQRRLIPNGE